MFNKTNLLEYDNCEYCIQIYIHMQYCIHLKRDEKLDLLAVSNIWCIAMVTEGGWLTYNYVTIQWRVLIIHWTPQIASVIRKGTSFRITSTRRRTNATWHLGEMVDSLGTPRRWHYHKIQQRGLFIIIVRQRNWFEKVKWASGPEGGYEIEVPIPGKHPQQMTTACELFMAF